MTEYKAIQFEIIECCNCHVLFCVTAQHKKHLLDSKEHFHCPNGHEQWYSGKCQEQVIEQLNETINQCRIIKEETTEELIKAEKTAKAYKMLYCREKKKHI